MVYDEMITYINIPMNHYKSHLSSHWNIVITKRTEVKIKLGRSCVPGFIAIVGIDDIRKYKGEEDAEYST